VFAGDDRVKPIKVLLLSPFFYPEAISTGKYNTVLADALIDAGAEVRVIASHPFYPGWKPVYSDATPDHVLVMRGGSWVRYPSSMILRRLVFEIWYTFHVLWTIWRRPAKVDIVIAVFPPSLFFCLAPLILPSTARKVGIVHDFQGVLGLTGEGVLKRQLQRVVRTIERKSFQSCQTLVVLSNAMARRAVKEYGTSRERLVVAYPFVSLKATSIPNANLAHLFPHTFQHVVYSGALGKKQNPFDLLKFFQTAALRFPDVRFHICSEGPIFDEICKMNVAHPVDGLICHGLVAEADLQELYARSTVQVIPQIAGSGDACLPSKLPNILASGCAVLAISEPDSELCNILSQCSGASVSTWDIDIFVDCLERVLNLVKMQSPEQRQALAAPLLAAQFSLDSLVDAVLDRSKNKVVEATTRAVRLESTTTAAAETS
jgi:glycosyltransferase involved in cell wall biosynthesis